MPLPLQRILQLETPVDPMSLSVSATDSTHNPFGCPFGTSDNDKEDDIPSGDDDSNSFEQAQPISSVSSRNNITER